MTTQRCGQLLNGRESETHSSIRERQVPSAKADGGGWREGMFQPAHLSAGLHIVAPQPDLPPHRHAIERELGGVIGPQGSK